ncbi:GTP pyrophosphokinase [Mycoplasma sp. P36-A1]|uniref:GTP pyrophosphokinase n=1 Tax=Mycoplasma sp. P36-A1 TaxID=3252900 RepID=UPI003C2BA811
MKHTNIIKPVLNDSDIDKISEWLLTSANIDEHKGLLARLRLMMLEYECAIKEIVTKLEILNLEMSLTSEHNPIQTIKSRMKTPKSIRNKLQKHNIEFSIENIEDNLLDIAGIRVIVGYIDDIYSVVDVLLRQDDITLVKCKDYIKNPKENGYRSLHLVVTVPVFFSNQKKLVNVEIQIRTIAMDFWASLEHSLRYKNESQIELDVLQQLKNAAEVISVTDKNMMELRKTIDQYDSLKE